MAPTIVRNANERQESLNVATRTGAAKPADYSKVIVDTTVQPKAVAFAVAKDEAAPLQATA